MTKSIKSIPEENFIVQWIGRFLPYWPLFLILIFLCMDAAWVYLYRTPKLYESNARILIKDEKKGAEDSQAEQGLNQLASKKIIENEMDVIQSRTLLDEVVQDLQLYIPVTAEGTLRKRSAYQSSPISVQGPYDPKSVASKKVYFVYDSATNSVLINKVSYPLDTAVHTPYGLLTFSPNRYYDGSPVQEKLYFQVMDPKEIVNSLQDRLKVTTGSKQSSILTLTLRDEVPVRADNILNQLMLVYNKAATVEKDLLAANTLYSVEGRLKSIEHELDSIEKKNQHYKSDKQVVDISEQGKLFLQNVSANDQKMGELNIQLSILDQAEQYVRGKNGAEGVVPSTAGITDPVLPNLIDKLYSLELEKESLKKTAGENNYAMTSITDRIEKIKPSILENIENQRKSLLASNQNIRSANQSYSSSLQTMPEKERELIEINRDLSIKNNIYTFLLQKREETVLAHAASVSESRIVDKARAGATPVSPKAKVIYVAAFLFALITGAAFVYMKEAFSRKIMFRDEINQLSSAPVIGEISANKNKTVIAIGNQQRTVVAEQFRKLRASLQFIGIKGTRKRILITSGIAGEGKSFVSLNLAATIALTGKKVVLIDSDLHNPSLHKKLDVQPGPGLADYLADDRQTNSIVQPTSVSNNLYFISTGLLPDNPSELIMNERLEELLSVLDNEFDYILIDSAPVGLVSDAYVIAPFCDATIFVIRHNYTPRAVVQQLDEETKINQLKNIGILFNDVRTRGYDNRYGYGYGHNYLASAHA